MRIQNCTSFSLIGSAIMDNNDDAAISIGVVLLFVIVFALIIVKKHGKSRDLRKAQKYDELMEEKNNRLGAIRIMSESVLNKT